MRGYTFLLSLAAHVVMIGAAIVAPIFATGDLPDPPRSSTFVLVRPEAPDVPPAAPRSAARISTSADAAPLVEPDGFTSEPPADPGADLAVADGAPPGLSGIPNSMVTGGNSIPEPPPIRQSAPVRTGGVVKPPEKIHHVPPEYPPIARSAGIGGVVILEAVIAEDGRVEDVRVLRSVRLLDEAAMTAVRQWRFTPTLLNGQPVRVLMTVTVSFTLR